MPEVEIDDTAPGEMVLVRKEKVDTKNKPSPLTFFLVFIPFIYLGAIAIILTTKLVKWGLRKSANNKNTAPVAAAYSQMNEL
ncbi:hypothetical protein Lepto7376_1770 [[Leptolyngbya] sp. PCC 7376]|nr:hypothetical protein Lepto7376_1770 [[Leptolyngbya] sp. PCC 7376]